MTKINSDKSGCRFFPVGLYSLIVFSMLVSLGCSPKLAEDSPLKIAELRGQWQRSDHAMVATAHPLASKAGRDILEQGGNAVDATLASAFVLGVVEPMMAGIGGGGSMTIWMKQEVEAKHVEFYASAGGNPGNLDEVPDSLLTPEQQVAVPGTVAGLLDAHERYGVLSRQEVMAAAVKIAKEGFTVHPLLARTVRNQKEKLHVDAAAAELFYPKGEPLRAGDRLVQEELAQTLEHIARYGKAGFYEGPVANAALSRLSNGFSALTMEDFENYRPRWRNPLLGDYKGYTVLAPPPPMAGMEILQTLNLLEDYELPVLGYPASHPEVLSILTDAIRISRADRAAWNGDPRDAGVPAAAIASEEYAADRSSWIGKAVPDSMPPGNPWSRIKPGAAVKIGNIDGFPYTARPRPAPLSEAGISEDTLNSHTTHVSIVDEQGNAVTLTFTMGQYFGSGVFAEGAFFNTAGRNFGTVAANQWGPYLTPRSSTAPTMVLQGEDVKLVVGSPGSGRIPPAVVQMIVYTLDYGMDPLSAIYMPRIYPFTSSNTVRIEDGYSSEAVKRLRERGYEPEIHSVYDMYFGGVHMVYVTDDGQLIGVADPRRNGAVSGY